MKNIINSVIAGTLVFASMNVCAEETVDNTKSAAGSTEEVKTENKPDVKNTPEDVRKRISFGLSSYASSVGTTGRSQIDFSGYSFVAAYAFTDNMALRGQYYMLENNKNSSWESTGIDLDFLFGTSLASEGFKYYGGLGLYTDEWTEGSISEEFSGLQFLGGLGYNWSAVSLEYKLAVRGADDYTEFRGADSGAASSSLIISARF